MEEDTTGSSSSSSVKLTELLIDATVPLPLFERLLLKSTPKKKAKKVGGKAKKVK